MGRVDTALSLVSNGVAPTGSNFGEASPLIIAASDGLTDVVDALVQAIKSVAILGDDGNLYVPREALVEAVNTMTGYQGLTGELTCNGGECNASGPSFQVVQDGVWVIP